MNLHRDARRRSGLLVCAALLFCVHAAAGDDAPEPLEIHFWYTPACPMCDPTDKAVTEAAKRFGDRVRLRKHNHAESEEVFDRYIDELDKRRIIDSPKLAVFAGDAELLGDEDIIANIEPMLEKMLRDAGRAGAAGATADVSRHAGDGGTTAPPDGAPVNRTDLFVVSVAALADGVNPCAFATVILFVSMLGTADRARREILCIGVSFIFAVYIAYFAIGLFFFEAMNALRKVKIAHDIILWGSFGLVSVLAALSFVDAIRAWRTGGTGRMLLVLPENLKTRIRKRLGATARTGGLVAAAFVTGVVVSFLEAACTGQVYFPLIAKLTRDPETAARGYLLLAWYNALFILPLLAVFLLAFFGVSVQDMARETRRRVWITKTLLAVVFAGMAVWLGSDLGVFDFADDDATPVAEAVGEADAPPEADPEADSP